MSKTSTIDTSALKDKLQEYAIKSRSHKCSPTIVALFRHGQQGHSE